MLYLPSRWDMSVPEDQYISTPPSGKARTLAALEENCKHSQPKRHLGSKHAPLLPIEPSSLVVDELHLLLRIGDILLRNIILQADSLDNKAYAEQGCRTDNHVRSLELLIRRCGISFTISPVRLYTLYADLYKFPNKRWSMRTTRQYLASSAGLL